jgi:nitrous oxide reductase accessory protein NosL
MLKLRKKLMKKILPLLVTILFMAIVAMIVISMAKEEQPVTIIKGNIEQKALPIKLNFTNDTECKMLIRSEENAAQVVAPDGRTWFFDDPGCMVLWLEGKPFKKEAKLWVHSIDTHQWIDAKKAHYGITDHTAMHYGFGARERSTKQSIDYEEMRLRMLRGENLTDPKIRKKLIGV